MPLAQFVPSFLRPATREVYYVASAIRYLGNRRICPCCGWHFRKFLPHGIVKRQNALCPRCQSLERHRLLWLFLRARTNLLSECLKVLHFAPEYSLQHRISRLWNINYVSADLDSPWAQHRIDITSIPFPDCSFDVVLCSHVLEHVPDDRKAMAELARILKPGGWAIPQVPLDRNRTETLEDFTVTDPKDREKLFGQNDHVRVYGRDYVDRLKSAGFDVEMDDFVSKFNQEEVLRYGLNKNEDICVRRKPARP